jgi:hypothetical protein
MRRIVLMTTLAVLVALSLLVSVGFASAKPNGHVVRPGESIQKAIKALLLLRGVRLLRSVRQRIH